MKKTEEIASIIIDEIKSFEESIEAFNQSHQDLKSTAKAIETIKIKLSSESIAEVGNKIETRVESLRGVVEEMRKETLKIKRITHSVVSEDIYKIIEAFYKDFDKKINNFSRDLDRRMQRRKQSNAYLPRWVTIMLLVCFAGISGSVYLLYKDYEIIEKLEKEKTEYYNNLKIIESYWKKHPKTEKRFYKWYSKSSKKK